MPYIHIRMTDEGVTTEQKDRRTIVGGTPSRRLQRVVVDVT